MPYSLSGPLGGCSSDQSTLASHGVNNNWPEEFQSAFCGNAASVSNQSSTNSTSAAVQYSHTNSYQSPVYDQRSPYSYPQSFSQSPQETVFGDRSTLGSPFSKTAAGLTGIQTNLPFKREPDFSPIRPSPSSATGLEFYTTSQHYRGSTPSLTSANSTPLTGGSKHILLTPELSYQPGNQLTLSPYHNTKTNSPMLYNESSGATPALNALNLDDSGFQLLTQSMGGPAPLRRPSSSVLLDSNFSSQGSQRAHLDPLELEDDLTAIDAHASNASGIDNDFGDININIVSDDPYPHNIPVTVALDNQPGGWLSPLTHFQAIPMTHAHELNATLHSNMYGGVIIEPTNWISHAPPSVPSPGLNVASSSHHERSEPLTPASSQHVLSPEGLRRVNNQNFESGDPQDALEAVRKGQAHTVVVNPRGVSDRTLAAAQANRKREPKFCCSVCGNSQTSKQNLENHIMSRHLQLKRFVCPVPDCNAKYGHARGVNRHLDSKHPGHRTKGKRGPSKRAPT